MSGPTSQNKEIKFSFNKDRGFVQTIAPRSNTSGAYVEIQGTVSASQFIGPGIGSGGGSGASVDSVTSNFDYTSSDFYSTEPNTLTGNASGFTVSTMVQPENWATGTEVIFGNMSIFQSRGGWYIGIDSDRWKFGVASDSDGIVLDNFGSGLQSLSTYQGRFIRRNFLLHLVFDGTDAWFHVNGQRVQGITPVSGYRPARNDLTPRIGRNSNVGNPLPCTTLGFVGGGYVESVFTEADCLAHYKLCLEENTFVDYSFTNLWVATSGSFDLTDSNGSLDWNLSGSLSQTTNISRW